MIWFLLPISVWILLFVNLLSRIFRHLLSLRKLLLIMVYLRIFVVSLMRLYLSISSVSVKCLLMVSSILKMLLRRFLVQSLSSSWLYSGVWSLEKWHYMPPPAIEPYTACEMFEFLMKRLFSYD